MRLTLAPDSRVLVDLRATGLLRAVGHSPTLVARCDAVTVDVDEGDLDVSVHARFPVDQIEPPADLDRSDRERMGDNLRSAEVLDAARFPCLEWRGRYAGTTGEGRLQGELSVRGVARSMTMTITVARDGHVLVARGTWTGRLTELGVRPYKALMGALRLEDWIALRLDARFVPAAPGE